MCCYSHICTCMHPQTAHSWPARALVPNITSIIVLVLAIACIRITWTWQLIFKLWDSYLKEVQL